MTTPLLPVSIAMATYNGARFLEEQLASLTAQTLLPAELVITDDGSTDDTEAIVARFARTAPFPVRFSRNPSRLNFGGNFLRAATLCTQPLIAFCDQDDRWLEHKLATIVPLLSDPAVTLVMHSGAVWDGQTTSGQFPAFAGDARHAPLSMDPLAFFPGFAMVFRADLLHEHDNSRRPRDRFGLIPPFKPMNHDSWIWLLAICLGEVVTLKEDLVLYRQHGGNTIGANDDEGKTSWKLALQNIDYEGLAGIEEENAAVFAHIGRHSPIAARRAMADQAAGFFGERAQSYHLRARMFLPEYHVFARLSAFLQLWRKGAYKDDPSRKTLGRRAAIKDFGVGVLPVYRFFQRGKT